MSVMGKYHQSWDHFNPPVQLHTCNRIKRRPIKLIRDPTRRKACIHLPNTHRPNKIKTATATESIPTRHE